MPISGKSTLAKKFAENEAWHYIDLDTVIEREYGKSIPRIFDEDGEEVFRKFEAKMLRELAISPKTIIALGGGTPMYYDSMDYILQRGLVVYVDVPISALHERATVLQLSNRPLLIHLETLNTLYNQRKSIYEQAHVQVRLQSSIDQMVLQLTQIIEQNKDILHS